MLQWILLGAVTFPGAATDTLEQIRNELFRAASTGLSDERLDEFLTRTFDLASEQVGTAEGLEALMFVTEIPGFLPAASEKAENAWTEAMDLLVEKYLEHEQFEMVVLRLGSERGRATQVLEYLRWIEDEADREVIRGNAVVAMVSQYAQRSRTGKLSDDEMATALALCQRVEDEYADAESMMGGTLGAMAGPVIFEIKHLGFDQVAPDILAADLDGVPFNLSDYRGKVVVLDFWGDW